MKKKIKICSNWADSESLTNLLISQFKTKTDDIKNLEFVYDNSYDYIIFNNYVTEEIKEGSKAFIFFHEPSWSSNHQRNFKDFKNLTIFGFDSNLYNSNNKVNETPALMFYGGRGVSSEGWNFWSYENITKTEFKKTKKISSVVSKLGENNFGYPSGCLYNQRYNLIKNLVDKCDFVDFYSWDEGKPNTLGFLHQKKDGIVNYKFSLCIENSNEKNYVSEKFYDCIMTDTIPIYYGCKNIKEIWPYNGFIEIENLDDLDKITQILNYINENCDYLYNLMITELKKIKYEFFLKNNFLKKINQIVNEN